MKKIIYSAFWIMLLLTCSEVSAQVGIGTTEPRGALDINSATSGFIPPQVQLTATNNSAPVVNPKTPDAIVAGTIVYNIASAGVAPTNVTPGYYFWNGTNWIKFSAGNTSIETEDDLRVTLDKPTSTSAAFLSLPGAGLSNLQIWYFEDGRVDGMTFTLQLPHNWKNGTTIYPHIHWIPRADGPGNVQWNMDYSWANLDTGIFTSDPNSPIHGTATGPFVMNKHLINDIGTGIDGTGKTYSSVLICRLYRDATAGNSANDTYANSAGGLSMDFHITIINPFVEFP